MSQRKLRVTNQDMVDEAGSDKNGKPFLVRLATSEELAQRITHCKKCENVIRHADDTSSIHCTLAYSRCRCHRIFQYKGSQQKLIDCGSKVSVVDGDDNSQCTHFGQNKMQHDFITPDMKNYDPGSSLPSPEFQHLHSPDSQYKLQAINEMGNEVKRNGMKGQPIDVGVKTEDHESSNSVMVDDKFKCKLPQIEKHRKIKRKPVSSPLLLVQRECKNYPISNLIDLVKYVDQSKKQKMKEIFNFVDKDGDGHILYAEFLHCLPKCAALYDCILKEFCASLNAVTYFGLREFILCYEIAERLSKLIKIPQSDLKVDTKFLEEILSPFMKYLSKIASEGAVTMEDIEDTVVKINRDLNSSISIAPVPKIPLAETGKPMHILDCLALSPLFLQMN